MSPKVRYEIDPHNRLVRTGGGLRQVLDGVFKLSGKNALSYHVKRPVASETPQQIKFSGNWSLNSRDQLVFSLDKWNRQIASNKLVLKTELLSASGRELVFTLTSRDVKGANRVSLLNLQGTWQADKNNRLVFGVEKGPRKKDLLILQGAWQLNKRHEIEYVFGGRQGVLVSLKGRWAMKGSRTLSYAIKGGSSILEFRASLQQALANKLVFVMGIGGEPAKKKIIFMGSWRLKAERPTALVFETTAIEGNFSSFMFGASLSPAKGAGFSLELKANQGESLGIALVLSKEMGTGQGFLRLQKSPEGIGAFAGYGCEW
ncbi:MAG: hypothetical protein WC732_00385 [Candidatus Omnitrophota bacterium]